MSKIKTALYVVLFVVATLVLPALILLRLVDAANNFAYYVITYGVILFAVLGYIVVSVKGMKNDLNNAIEDIKKQNAAIAYKLTKGVKDELGDSEIQDEAEEKIPAVDTSKVNLNPADELVVDKINTDDDFDDFK